MTNWLPQALYLGCDMRLKGYHIMMPTSGGTLRRNLSAIRCLDAIYMAARSISWTLCMAAALSTLINRGHTLLASDHKHAVSYSPLLLFKQGPVNLCLCHYHHAQTPNLCLLLHLAFDPVTHLQHLSHLIPCCLMRRLEVRENGLRRDSKEATAQNKYSV